MQQLIVSCGASDGQSGLALVSDGMRIYDEYVERVYFQNEPAWLGLVLALHLVEQGGTASISLPLVLEAQYCQGSPIDTPLVETYYEAAYLLHQSRHIRYIIYNDDRLNAMAQSRLTVNVERDDPYLIQLHRPMTNQESLALILERAKTHELSDFELHRLKVHGGTRDIYGKYSIDELRALVLPDDRRIIDEYKSLMGSPKWLAEAYRWNLRGLTAAQAARKVEIKIRPNLSKRLIKLVGNTNLDT
jgi:hypothetical protein